MLRMLNGRRPSQRKNEEPQPHRSTREQMPSSIYLSSEYILIIDEGESETYEKVNTHRDNSYWLKAMQEKMDSL